MKKYLKSNILILTVMALICSLFIQCSQFKKRYSPFTQEFITLVESNPEMKELLVASIKQAETINPDTITNPVRTLEDYYDFLDWATRTIPWSVMYQSQERKLYDKIDQSLDYFYFLCDQPLKQLEGKGYYNNSLQYHEPYRTWLAKYVKTWGNYLSTPESWKPEYYETVYNDSSFGLQKGWYEDASNWKSFNDFFSRHLFSPDMRPIAEPENAAIITSAVDSKPQGVWAIDAQSNIVQKEGVLIKSRVFNSISALLGPDCVYGDSFAGGTLTHSLLDVNDYHRYHFPVSGIIYQLSIIPGNYAAGGIMSWNTELNRYILQCKTPDWQSIETRGCVIVETPEYGLVALLPIGMSQVCSVNFEENLRVGDTVKKGDMLGYFLFGGSDFVILFQKDVKFELTVPQTPEGSYHHLLMGEELGKVKRM